MRVAIVREEGSNGDREMAAAVYAAGLEPWDVTMSDLIAGRAALDSFRGLVFVGGFSYADTLDSAQGWAGEDWIEGGVFVCVCVKRKRESVRARTRSCVVCVAGLFFCACCVLHSFFLF